MPMGQVTALKWIPGLPRFGVPENMMTILKQLSPGHLSYHVIIIGASGTQSLVAIRCLRIIFSAQLCKAHSCGGGSISGACPFGDLSPRYDITETKLQQATGQFLQSI